MFSIIIFHLFKSVNYESSQNSALFLVKINKLKQCPFFCDQIMLKKDKISLYNLSDSSYNYI